MFEQLLKQEIAKALDFMAQAADTWRDFAIGKLSALLWAQGRGSVPHAECVQQALDAWENLRKETP